MRYWILLAALSAHAQPAATDAEMGKVVFRIYCAPCHGRNAEGDRGPSLTRGTFHAGDRDEDLFRVIEQGIPGTNMGGFATLIAHDNVGRIVAYLRSIAQPQTAVAGEASVGEKLFWGRAGCSGCHRVNGKGGSFGPELSRIGRASTAKSLRQSIVDPNSEISTAFETIAIETRDGKKIVGLELGFDQFSARFRELNGTYHSFLREEVKDMKRLPTSLMPSYAGKLSEAELNGVIAYLVSLRGEGK